MWPLNMVGKGILVKILVLVTRALGNKRSIQSAALLEPRNLTIFSLCSFVFSLFS